MRSPSRLARSAGPALLAACSSSPPATNCGHFPYVVTWDGNKATYGSCAGVVPAPARLTLPVGDGAKFVPEYKDTPAIDQAYGLRSDDENVVTVDGATLQAKHPGRTRVWLVAKDPQHPVPCANSQTRCVLVDLTVTH